MIKALIIDDEKASAELLSIKLKKIAADIFITGIFHSGRSALEAMDAEEKFMLTTEKDAMRLIKFNDTLRNLPWYVLPIEHGFLFNGAAEFDAAVIDFVKNFKMEERDN